MKDRKEKELVQIKKEGVKEAKSKESKAKPNKVMLHQHCVTLHVTLLQLEIQ